MKGGGDLRHCIVSNGQQQAKGWENVRWGLLAKSNWVKHNTLLYSVSCTRLSGSVDFLAKRNEAAVLNLPSILVVLEYLSRACFFTRKMLTKNKSKFLIKNVFIFGSSAFAENSQLNDS